MRQIILALCLASVISVAQAQTTAKEWFDLAMTKVTEKKFDEALNACNKAISLDPNFAEAYNRRAYTYSFMNEYAKAIVDCNKAISLDPTMAKAYYNRGMAYYKSQKYTEAVPDFKQVMTLNDKLPNEEFYAAYGYSAYRAEKYSDAVTAYDKAIGANPNQARYWHIRGTCNYYINKIDESLKDYTEAIRLDPAAANPYIDRAATYSKLKKYAEASADYKIGAELDEKGFNEPIWASYGYAAYAAKLPYYGITAYDKAIAANATKGKYFYFRGLCKEMTNQNEAAIADYTEAIRLGVEFISCWRDRGGRYHALNQYDKAIDDYNHYLKETPTDHYTLNMRALCYNEKGRFQEAVKDIDEACKLDPAQATYVNNRAYAYYMMANYEQSLKDYEACHKLGGKDFVVYLFYWDQALIKYSEQTVFSPDVLYSSSKALLDRNVKYEENITALNNGIARYPNDGRLYLCKYICMKRDVKFGADRVAAIEKAAQLLPNDPAAHYYLGFERFLEKREAEAKAEFDKSMALGGQYLIAENARDLGNGNYKQVIINKETQAYLATETQTTNNNTSVNSESIRIARDELRKGLIAQGATVVVEENCANNGYATLTRQPYAELKPNQSAMITVICPQNANVLLADGNGTPCTKNDNKGTGAPVRIMSCEVSNFNSYNARFTFNITASGGDTQLYYIVVKTKEF